MLQRTLKVRALAVFTLLTAAFTSPLCADEITIPAANAGISATGLLSTLLREAPNSRTYQFMISSTLLTSIPIGSEISGISFRLGSGVSSWPATAATFAEYEIKLATCNNAASSFSTGFANNPSADEVTVRSGPLTFTASAFPGGITAPVANFWGPIIAFSTPFVYNGTDIVFTIRHSGNDSGTSAFIDTVNVGAGGHGTTLNAASAAGNTATTGTIAGFPVSRIVYRAPATPSVRFSPNQKAAEAGDGGLSTLLNTASRTYQAVFGAAELSGLPAGSLITGVSYRADTAVGPSAAQAFADYSIQMAASLNSPSTMSTTFAANVGSDALTVRSGVLTVAANSYPAAPAGETAQFGPVIDFATPYQYKGGNLLMTVRHAGNPGASMFLDAVTAADPNFGERFRGRFATGYTATTSTSESFTVKRFSVIPATVIPETRLISDGTSNISTPFTNAANTSQLILSAAALRGIPIGSTIDAMEFRLDGGQGVFPSGGDAVFARYDVQISTAANSPATMSATIADNEGFDATLVRSGPMIIGSGDFPSSAVVGQVNEYGTPVRFTRPFTYRGGDLSIVIRHSDHNRNLVFFDAMNRFTDPNNGTLYRYRSTGGSPDSTTTGSEVNFPVMRLRFTPSQHLLPALANINGNSNNNVPLRADARTIQILLDQSQLESESVRPGAIITGLSFRLEDTRPSWPPVDADWLDYRIDLSASNRVPSTMSNTYSDNVAAPTLTVRSGSLTIPALALKGDGVAGTVNPHTYYFDFERAYVYQGGSLCLTIRHDGNLTGTTMEVDGTSSAAQGFGTRINCRSSAGFSASTGTSITAPFVRFAFYNTFPPCLADIVSIGGLPPPDGLLTGDDFNAFIAAFAGADLLADICGIGGPPSLPDGLITGDDFNAFISAFAGGCP